MATKDENNPWTSIDSYYKGFHVKHSFPKTYGREKLITFIEELIDANFQPSWNTETNIKQDVEGDPIMKATKGHTKPCPIHGDEMTEKTGKWGTFYSHKLGDGWCNGK